MANIIKWQTDESKFSDSGPAGAEPQDQNVSEPENDGTITQVKANENAVFTKLADPLNNTNWNVWRDAMILMLKMCDVLPYMQGHIQRPSRRLDPIGTSNWGFNDTYAIILLNRNIAPAQSIHISQCKTSRDMWMNLEAVHESQSHETITSYICNLFRTYAEEEDDIIEHVNKLKQYWERISILGDENFKFSDHLFRVIITSSLPPSWDAFMLRSGVFFTQKK